MADVDAIQHNTHRTHPRFLARTEGERTAAAWEDLARVFAAEHSFNVKGAALAHGRNLPLDGCARGCRERPGPVAPCSADGTRIGCATTKEEREERGEGSLGRHARLYDGRCRGPWDMTYAQGRRLVETFPGYLSTAVHALRDEGLVELVTIECACGPPVRL